MVFPGKRRTSFDINSRSSSLLKRGSAGSLPDVQDKGLHLSGFTRPNVYLDWEGSWRRFRRRAYQNSIGANSSVRCLSMHTLRKFGEMEIKFPGIAIGCNNQRGSIASDCEGDRRCLTLQDSNDRRSNGNEEFRNRALAHEWFQSSQDKKQQCSTGAPFRSSH